MDEELPPERDYFNLDTSIENSEELNQHTEDNSDKRSPENGIQKTKRSCNVCEQTFSASRNLRKVKQPDSGKELYICRFCFKIFSGNFPEYFSENPGESSNTEKELGEEEELQINNETMQTDDSLASEPNSVAETTSEPTCRGFAENTSTWHQTDDDFSNEPCREVQGKM